MHAMTYGLDTYGLDTYGLDTYGLDTYGLESLGSNVESASQMKCTHTCSPVCADWTHLVAAI